jgi:hypothetical protein
MTDEKLRNVAVKCRALAETCTTEFAREALQEAAADLELRAEGRDGSSEGQPSMLFCPTKQ